jgi:putative SOS response-associated peptidase YedK
MCGRYYCSEDDLEELSRIVQSVSDSLSGNTQPKWGEIAPSMMVAAFTSQGLELEKWGLPKWDGKGLIINARSETVETKPMFQKLFLHKRCVLPASYFFEWERKDGKVGTKYRISPTPNATIYLAGIVSSVFIGSQQISQFVILTQEASDSMKLVHSRQPLVISHDKITDWVNSVEYARQVIIQDPQQMVLDPVA